MSEEPPDNESIEKTYDVRKDPLIAPVARCIGNGGRCQREALGLLFAPDDGHSPGAWFCEEHATAIITEYREKLGEEWTFRMRRTVASCWEVRSRYEGFEGAFRTLADAVGFARELREQLGVVDLMIVTFAAVYEGRIEDGIFQPLAKVLRRIDDITRVRESEWDAA